MTRTVGFDPSNFQDGETVEYGEVLVAWSIRAFHGEDGKVDYDWTADRIQGDYTESDDYFDSIEDAKADLGVD